jgi:two-component system OmpR family sensor kinase
MTTATAPARSIRRELIGWLTLGLLVAVAAAAVATYLRARDEANALFDYQLTQMASSVTGMPLAARGPPATAPGSDALVVEIWNRNGVEVYLSQPQRRLPQYGQLGFNTVATDAGEWRVFTTLAGDQVVQVAQPMKVRRELAASMALSTILPLLAVLPFLAAVVWFGIARGIAPLERIAAAVARRSPRTLSPLSESGLPREVQPLVQALNGLLARLDAALDAQRSFIADAAHELRTPLTAVHLQVQLAERAGTDAERVAALRELRAGLDRATHLVGQLLTLAREEPGVADRAPASVDLTDIARSVISEHVAQAGARGVDLGFTTARDGDAPPVTVRGDAASLHTLLSNLVDNALRYTPAGGRVDVAVTGGADAGEAVLTVRDSGPGIPAAEQARVFDRFYRAPDAADLPGSGLGLAIVKRIAERHGATIALGPGLPGPAGPGLTVTVRFPAAPPAVASIAP